MEKPPIVSAEEWQTARDELLTAEKEATRTLDALAARRRRLPMVEIENKYTFASPDGPKTLLDLFNGKNQLAMYQFMDRGPDHFCPGCTAFTDNIPQDIALPILADRGVAWATCSDMPLQQIESYKKERGWTLPFVSSHGTTWTEDINLGGGFRLMLFLRDGDKVYLTYSTGSRGVDRLMFVPNILDLAVYGRQEDWEDSPTGWPQRPTYG
ncbi:MAG: DUF899 domain-containing protein [Catenulispora sp.]|nr:DUF899 domain-containing protein [Catenulispora sp.]